MSTAKLSGERLAPHERIVEVMTAITEDGPLPYAELRRRTAVRVTPGRLQEVVKMAAERQVLKSMTGDGDLPDGLRKGRANRVEYVEISREAGYVVGINIGRTYFALGVADPNGRLISTVGEPPPRGLRGRKKDEAWETYRTGQIEVHRRQAGSIGKAVLRRAAKETNRRLERLEIAPNQVRGVTLSVPAPTSATESRLLTHSIEARLASVGNIETTFRKMLGPRAFTKLEKVVLANDADVAARGEVRYGDAYGKKDVLVVHAAFGVGGGIVTDGKVLRTGGGGGAGEIGHCVPIVRRDEGIAHGLVELDPDSEVFTCGCECQHHLEGLAGGEAIVERLAASTKRFGEEPPERLAELLANPDRNVAETLDELLAAVAGDEPWQPGLAALRDAAYLVGGAVHTLVHLFKPEAVYICGKLSEAGEPFLEAVEEGFEAVPPLDGYEPPIKLGTAQDEFMRRLIMVRGAAMTAVRATKPLITRADLENIEFG